MILLPIQAKLERKYICCKLGYNEKVSEQREEVTYLRKTDLAQLVTIEISSLKTRIAQATILVTQNQQRL